jgi:hypothetical protein
MLRNAKKLLAESCKESYGSRRPFLPVMMMMMMMSDDEDDDDD